MPPPRHQCGHYDKRKQKFGDLEVKDAQRLRLLEEENRKLKKLVFVHPRLSF